LHGYVINSQCPQRGEVEKNASGISLNPLFSPMSKETSLGHLNSFVDKDLISLLKNDIHLQLYEAGMSGKF
jgi:hypothetical protein